MRLRLVDQPELIEAVFEGSLVCVEGGGERHGLLGPIIEEEQRRARRRRGVDHQPGLIGAAFVVVEPLLLERARNPHVRLVGDSDDPADRVRRRGVVRAMPPDHLRERDVRALTRHASLVDEQKSVGGVAHARVFAHLAAGGFEALGEDAQRVFFVGRAVGACYWYGSLSFERIDAPIRARTSMSEAERVLPSFRFSFRCDTISEPAITPKGWP
jgi:hypothetical protein